MKDVKLKLEYMALDELTPYENNAKIHTPEQIDQICASIKDFGMNDPIAIVGKDNIIVEGHGRLMACKKLGINEVPVIRLDHLNEQERKAYTLAHNKLTMNTGFDMDKLNAELQELVEMDMADYGFIEVDETPVELDEDGYDPEEETFPEPKAKRGDIYKLGNHRLMCGDSTSADDVAKLMGDAQVDLLLTDPPYNVNYGARGKKYKEKASEGTVYTAGMDDRTILNDNMEDTEFLEFLTNVFKAADSVMKPGAPFYIWHADSEGYNFRKACRQTNWQVRQCLIWVKNTLVLGRQDYQWIHEPCLYGWKEGAGHYFIDDRTQTTVLEEKPIDPDKLTHEEAIKLIKKIMRESGETTILRENKPQNSELHPTMKPIALFGRLIQNSCKKGENVLDLFGGSGTTIVACEELGRNGYAMELDPHYVDVIIERWESLTGQKAEKVEK